MKTKNQFLLLAPTDATLDRQSGEVSEPLAASTRPRLWEPFQDATYRLAFVLLVLSGGLFLAYELFGDSSRNDGGNTGMIAIHYSLACGFSIHLLTKGLYRSSREDYEAHRPTRWLNLLLWLISAYALNREMAVFQQSTLWLCWALVLVGLAMTSYAWKEYLSVRWQQVQYAVLATGWCLFTYMAFYLVWLYPISVPMVVGLGLSLHTFVPFAFSLALGKRLWHDANWEEHLRLGIWIGLCAPVAIVILFLTGWIQTVTTIEQTKQEATIRKTSDLPDWVLIAQKLKPGWITNRVLLSGRVYDEGSFFRGSSWGFGGMTPLDEVRQHDPLVVIASFLHPADVLSDTEQLALLKTLLSERHGTEEKFWTGRHLTTEEVVSQVRIWPQFRLSYTEKTIRIRNKARNTTEEALLTFQLSPGSTVSSMSLWVNGKEEPAYLTTVAKADTAYRAVVNRESRHIARDPSVVYWQEGSRVTVRVFPCRAGEDRRVKLGITSPLRLDGSTLTYQNPSFEGPQTESASELVSVAFAAPPTNLQSPWLFSELTDNTLHHQGDYRSDWSLTFQAPPLSSESFALDGKTYRMTTYQPTQESFLPTDIFLDVNAEWTKDEFKTICQAASRTKSRSWVFLDGLQEVTDQNIDAVYNHLKAQSFSLFPIYRMSNPATALLVTKGTPTSPLLADMRDSHFADRFGQIARHSASIHTFSLNSTRSPYIRSLAELGVLTVAQGTARDLVKLLEQTHQFPNQSNEKNRVILPEAGVVIQEQSATSASRSSAPDHLARLFSYNHLLQQIGRHYFVKNYQTEALIQEAQQANVVSPLSSLIVLETQADYDRFGIKKDHSGLDNATLKQEGAVPEPHEWALLLMLVGLLGWLSWQKRYAVR